MSLHSVTVEQPYFDPEPDGYNLIAWRQREIWLQTRRGRLLRLWRGRRRWVRY